MAQEGLLGYYFALSLLIVLSGLFSASETAFFSLNTLRLERLAKEGNRKAKELLNLLSNPADLIATILVGNEMVNVAIAATSAVLFVKLLGEEIGAAVAVPVTVITLLIFGEVTPKTLAIKYSEKYAFFILPFIKLVYYLTYPVRLVLVGFASLLLKPFGVELFSTPKAITDEEFMLLVAQGAKEGTIAQEEKELIDRTLDLGESSVREIMVPKHKVFALKEDTPVEEALKLLSQVKFSRIPVYKDSLDQVTGILYTRKILPLTLREEDLKRPVKDFAVEPYFVTEFLTVDRLLEEMEFDLNFLSLVGTSPLGYHRPDMKNIDYILYDLIKKENSDIDSIKFLVTKDELPDNPEEKGYAQDGNSNWYFMANRTKGSMLKFSDDYKLSWEYKQEENERLLIEMIAQKGMQDYIKNEPSIYVYDGKALKRKDIKILTDEKIEHFA
jgi:Mg2+/Co2+ transporter CorB